MPENIKTLRRRIRSVVSTRKITRTMEMISAAKLRRVQKAMTAARPYAAKIQSLIAHLASSGVASDLPLFEEREGGRLTVVVVASDRGLCGGYNSTLLREAERFIAENGGREQVDVYAVGKRAADFLRKRGYNLIGSTIHLGGNVEVNTSSEIGDAMVQRFLEREASRVVLLYNAYISAVAFKPVAAQFLPLSAGGLGASEANGVFAHEVDYIFEPSAARVFEELLPRYVRSKLYAALLEAMTTEHNARRIAMSNATENSDEMITSLSLRANKARQASITKEILEIVGGAEALKG